MSVLSIAGNNIYKGKSLKLYYSDLRESLLHLVTSVLSHFIKLQPTFVTILSRSEIILIKHVLFDVIYNMIRIFDFRR